jgi:energy-coupling factor transport system permease protein
LILASPADFCFDSPMRSLSDLTLGNYIPGESQVHRLDPRLKLAAGLVLMGIPFALTAPAAVALHSALVLGLVALAGIPLGAFMRGLRFFLWLFLFTAALHLFFTPGEALLRLGPATITREGVAGGLLTAWRLLAAIALSALLTHTTTPLQITRGVERFLSPFDRALARLGMPVQDLALMMMMALRFIPVLAEESSRVWLAQRARGADPGRGGVRRRARALLSLLLPLFAGVFRRADELALALESRGFVPGRRRTSMVELAWTGRESAALLLAAGWAGAVLAL